MYESDAEDLPEVPKIHITGRTKAAILLIFLGPETSGVIFQSLEEIQIWVGLCIHGDISYCFSSKREKRFRV